MNRWLVLLALVGSCVLLSAAFSHRFGLIAGVPFIVLAGLIGWQHDVILGRRS